MWKFIVISGLLFGAVNLTDVSYYEILGVSKQATAQEIRQAYKKLAVKFHPDKNPNGDEKTKFLKITEAYETLKDPSKRQEYDRYGSQTYSRRYDYRSQSEYDNLFYNGLYHDDPYVETLSGATFYSYLKEGFHFINFYSPFCPPCQSVADDWKKLGEIYKGIVKIGAVNCKYQNSFCYNSMRISSYPTLLFYPNGKTGNFVYYRGDRSIQSLDEFIMQFLRNQVHVPVIAQIRNTDRPMAYVLGSNRLDSNALIRIGYHLHGLVQLVIVDDDDIRSQLTQEDYTTVVLKYNNINQEISSTDEKEVLKEIVGALPAVEQIGPEKLKDIRNKLRSGSHKPWVLLFSANDVSKVQLHQMKIAFPHINFGEIDCEKWEQLCNSLHVESAPGWGVLKRGGGYQRASPNANIKHFIQTASEALNLYTLSPSDLLRILDGGESGSWVLLVAPHGSSWEHIVEALTRATRHFEKRSDISFGIMSCSLTTDKYCRQVTHRQAVVLVQNGGKQNIYNGKDYEQQLIEYVDMILDSGGLQLNEKQVLEILDPSSREHVWLVAYLPANCGKLCEQLSYEWMIVAKKLRPLEFVRVGVLDCGDAGGFCQNVRSPTARLYPIASGHHYSVSLQHLSQAPYMLEWALEYIDDSIQKLSWQMFSRNVIAEELNPTSKKPWLVYFHSPRCYSCYEKFSDFAIAGILLGNGVQLGRVNCLNERSLCQHEQIMSYPSLRLYLNRNQHQQFSSVITIQVRDYQNILQDVKPHIVKYNAGFERSGFNIKHDEF